MIDPASLWTALLVLAPSLAAAVIALGRLPAQRAALWSAAASSLSAAVALSLVSRGPRRPVVSWLWAPELESS